MFAHALRVRKNNGQHCHILSRLRVNAALFELPKRVKPKKNQLTAPYLNREISRGLVYRYLTLLERPRKILGKYAFIQTRSA
jgi:hypothetical protein